MTPSPQSESTSDEIAISVKGLSKAYRIWRDPSARLKAPIWDAIGSSLHKAIQPEAMKARLSHEGKSRYYRDFYAVKGLDLEIKKGEAVGIIGRNGSGKSTLLQMLAGTLTPTTGEIKVNGRIAALLELGSGFNPEFTGKENVYLNASILGLSEPETTDKYEEIKDFSDIGEFIDQPVKTYSSGMLVRLAFAVQAVTEPEVLIVDEALAVGDEAFQRKCICKIQALKDKGTTILFVSHAVGQVLDLCSRAILIDSGELIIDSTPKTTAQYYHKLLYSQKDQTTNVLKEIEQVTEQNSPEDTSDPTPQKTTSTEDIGSFYDPALQPDSTVEYESRGVRIVCCQVKNRQGKQVNNLVHGEVYSYTYQVEVHKDAYGLKFGLMIKTINGIELTGMVSSAERISISHVEQNKTVDVEFKFRCLFAPGVYFPTAGVKGIENGEHIYLHRIVDASMFRVQPYENQVDVGLVHLLSDPRCRVF